VRPVRRATKGTKPTWEQSVLPALRDPLVLQAPPVQPRLGRRVRRATKVTKATWEQLVLPAP
jgi:hypothetical protein